jgi:hypothetical protein
MGHAPPRSQVREPTYLELAKRRYIHGLCTVEELEGEIELILSKGIEDYVPPPRPPKPFGAKRIDY